MIYDSKLLGEKVFIWRDHHSAKTDLVTYSHKEIQKLKQWKLTDDHLRFIHMMKKELGGIVEQVEIDVPWDTPKPRSDAPKSSPPTKDKGLAGTLFLPVLPSNSKGCGSFVRSQTTAGTSLKKRPSSGSKERSGE